RERPGTRRRRAGRASCRCPRSTRASRGSGTAGSRSSPTVARRSHRELAQGLFFGGEAAHEARVAEDALAVVLDELGFLRQLHAERIEAPDDRRERAVSQAHFRIEEELRGLE